MSRRAVHVLGFAVCVFVAVAGFGAAFVLRQIDEGTTFPAGAPR